MIDRQKATTWISERLGHEERIFFNPEALKLCIQNLKFEYVNLFWESAWTDEIIDIYSKVLKESNTINSITNPPSNVIKIKLLKKFISDGLLNNALELSTFPNDWSEEILELFSLKIGSCLIDKTLFLKNRLIFYKNPNILRSAIINRSYNIISCFGYEAWTKENQKLFASIAADFVKGGYDEELPSGLMDPPIIYVELIKNGIYKYAHRINYMGEESRRILLNSEENINIFIDAFDKMNDERNYIFKKDIFKNSSKLLRKIMECNDIQYLDENINFFNENAWTKENIDLFADFFMDKCKYFPKLLFSSSKCLLVSLQKQMLNNVYFYKDIAWAKENMDIYFDMLVKNDSLRSNIINKPYFNYKICYLNIGNNYNHTFKRLDRLNISQLNNDILNEYDLMYSLGEKIFTGELSIDPIYDSLFKFIYQTKSAKIVLLIRSLIDDNLQNINNLFNENGITEYFNDYLLFDQDYREFCLNNNIDFLQKCQNKIFIQYLLLCTKFPQLSKNIYISPDNVEKYFTEKGIKKELLEDLFTTRTIELLCELTKKIKEPILDGKKQFIVNKMNNIENRRIRKSFFDYIYSHIDTLEESKILEFYNIIRRVEFSNSSEIRAFGDFFIDKILEYDNPSEELEKIENIFIKDNIPFVGKIYTIFKKLNPNYKRFSFSNIAPTLKNSDDEEKDKIIFSDLIRIELGSNNRSLQKYLVFFFNCNMLYELIRDEKIALNSLNQNDIQELNNYIDKIKFLCDNILKINIDDITKYSNPIKKIYYIETVFKSMTNNYTNIPDFLVEIICKGAGFATLIDMICYSVEKPKEMEFLHKKYATFDFKLEKGDYIKGINDIKYLGNILQNGSVAAEFLGDSAKTDCTPLDTDLSLISEGYDSIKDSIVSTEAHNYGTIYLVLKGNLDRFDITRTNESEDSIQQNKKRIEIFYTGALGKTHYGIRTGFASSEIDYIIASSHFDRIGLEIAMNGIYIPVVDIEGNLKFTPQDYEKLRKKMSGLSYYGINTYELSTELITDDVLSVCEELEDNMKEVSFKRNAIYKVVTDALGKFGINLKTYMDNDLTNGTIEMLDTGSTGRGTNVANDSDFDFIVRIDREIFLDENKMYEIKSALLDKFKKNGSGDFRLTDVYFDEIGEPLDIDMTFVAKSNKLDYATENCIQDRLETIKNLYPDDYKYVVANVVLAKKFFKNALCYKPKHASKNPQGGLGGVGIENWVLQHGGSFLEAAKDFINIANQYSTLQEFQQNYVIPDFGCNHLAEKNGNYPHDNFVMNLNEDGFIKMKESLKKYISEYKMSL